MGNIYELRICIFHQILKVVHGLWKAEMWACFYTQGSGWCLPGVIERKDCVKAEVGGGCLFLHLPSFNITLS